MKLNLDFNINKTLINPDLKILNLKYVNLSTYRLRYNN